MLSWGRATAERLRESGLGLAVSVVDTPTASRVLFANDARSALVLAVEGDRVRAGLELVAIQAPAVRAELSNPERALELAAALEALPEQFVIELSGDRGPLEATRCTIDDVRSLLDRMAGEKKTLFLGWTVPRQIVVEHATLLEEQLKDALAALGRVFSLLTGGADGPAPAKTERVHTRRKGPARRADDRTSGADTRRDRVLEDHEGPKRRVHRDLSPPSQDGSSPAPPGRGPSANEGQDADPHTRAETDAERREFSSPRRLPTRSASRTPRHRPGNAIERGARVRVLDGAFSGKVGTVQELDGKGGARVMLGLLAVRIDVKNLVVHEEGGRRPVLGTSHRKPVPARS